MMYFSHKKMAN